jgi:hypothetical protein
LRTEQITIRIRDLHAASNALRNTAPEESVILSRPDRLTLLVWEEDGMAHEASVLDGRVTRPDE